MIANTINHFLSSNVLPAKLQCAIIKAPKYFLKPLNHIPNELQAKAISHIISQVLHDALVNQELEFLRNQWLQVDIIDVPYVFFVSVNESKSLIVTKQLSQQPDVTFAGSSISMLQLMSRNIDPDTLFFQRKLLVTGDTELGLEIKNFLDDMDLQRLPKLIHTGLQKYNELVINQGGDTTS